MAAPTTMKNPTDIAKDGPSGPDLCWSIQSALRDKDYDRLFKGQAAQEMRAAWLPLVKPHSAPGGAAMPAPGKRSQLSALLTLIERGTGPAANPAAAANNLENAGRPITAARAQAVTDVLPSSMQLYRLADLATQPLVREFRDRVGAAVTRLVQQRGVDVHGQAGLHFALYRVLLYPEDVTSTAATAALNRQSPRSPGHSAMAGDTEWHQTPLHVAASRGSHDMAKMLIREGANVELKTGRGASVLQLALQCTPERPKLIKVLLESGACIAAHDLASSAEALPCIVNCPACVPSCAKDPNTTSCRALRAVYRQELQAAEDALQGGPDRDKYPQPQPLRGSAALYWSLLSGQEQVALMLMQAGAVLAPLNKADLPARLLLAARFGMFHAFRALLGAGELEEHYAVGNPQDRRCLQRAVWALAATLMVWEARHGGEISREGWLALQDLLSRTQRAGWDQHLPLSFLLDPELLHHAIKTHNNALGLKLLLQYGVDVDTRDVQMHTTPIFTAVHAFNLTACQELIGAGADVHSLQRTWLPPPGTPARPDETMTCLDNAVWVLDEVARTAAATAGGVHQGQDQQQQQQQQQAAGGTAGQGGGGAAGGGGGGGGGFAEPSASPSSMQQRQAAAEVAVAGRWGTAPTFPGEAVQMLHIIDLLVREGVESELLSLDLRPMGRGLGLEEDAVEEEGTGGGGGEQEAAAHSMRKSLLGLALLMYHEPRWSTSMHRRWPPTFRAALRTLLLASHRGSTSSAASTAVTAAATGSGSGSSGRQQQQQQQKVVGSSSSSDGGSGGGIVPWERVGMDVLRMLAQAAAYPITAWLPPAGRPEDSPRDGSTPYWRTPPIGDGGQQQQVEGPAGGGVGAVEGGA